MIDIRITDKSFAGAPILRDVAFQVAQGECVAILGPSGIGKSTLLRIIAGLDRDFTGTVTRPDRLAMVFQEPNLLRWRTVRDNLCIPTGIDANRAETALAAVGLSGKGGHYPAQLSLGQQRRLALARAFAADPALLILDEPFASLDPDRAGEMLSLTTDLMTRIEPATIFVTHSEEEAARLSTRILRLDGSPASIRI